MTHITQECSLMGKEHIMLYKKKSKKSKELYILELGLLCPLNCVVVLSAMHEDHLPFFSVRTPPIVIQGRKRF